MRLRWIRLLPLLAMGLAGMGPSAQAQPPTVTGCETPLPGRLSDTGLYQPGPGLRVNPELQPVSPVYPLWSDGTGKRRWILLPPGTAIDASDPDAWEFPRGTRLWKEFAYDRPVETRYIERCADGSWRFAAYQWQEDGLDALLVPEAGARRIPVQGAPLGRYTIPAQDDCRSCHEGAPTPVLGVSALQLSPIGDPAAPHAERDRHGADLAALVARGWVRGLPEAASNARVEGRNPDERAALGYLHGNCGHCHNARGPLNTLGLDLAQDASNPLASRDRTLGSVFGSPSRFRDGASDATTRAVAGDAGRSVLVARLRSRNPYTQMPPLGTSAPDLAGLELVERWINNPNVSKEETQ